MKEILGKTGYFLGLYDFKSCSHGFKPSLKRAFNILRLSPFFSNRKAEAQKYSGFA